MVSRWWFQRFVIFQPDLLGNDPFWLIPFRCVEHQLGSWKRINFLWDFPEKLRSHACFSWVACCFLTAFGWWANAWDAMCCQMSSSRSSSSSDVLVMDYTLLPVKCWLLETTGLSLGQLKTLFSFLIFPPCEAILEGLILPAIWSG